MKALSIADVVEQQLVPLSAQSLYRIARTDPTSPFRKRRGVWMVVDEDLIEWVRQGERGRPRAQDADPMPKPRHRVRRSGRLTAQVNRGSEIG